MANTFLPVLPPCYPITAPSVLPIAASSFPPFVPASSEPAPIVAAAAPSPAPCPCPLPLPPAPAPAGPAFRVGLSRASHALVLFHEDSSLWPYPRAPLNDRDNIVELDLADTSALSDVDASAGD